MKAFPTEALKKWFRAHARALPFRQNRTPYRVWVSEVMLQQTQAVVVIPYFERWMEAFPTVEALAQAPIERVLKLWEGLGYYSRARNLHKGAQQIVARGGFPLDPAEVNGIGPYTAGAIRSFAFREKAAAVDGNVLRVLARYTGEKGEIDRPSIRKKLTTYAEEILPEEESWLVTEGLIELGALVCQKKAHCAFCPLKRGCVAHRDQLTLPNRSARQKATLLERTVGVIIHEEAFLLKKGERGKVMADLYEFPFLEGKQPWEAFAQLGLRFDYISALPIQKHTFTRFRVTLYPHLLRAHARIDGEWKKREEIGTLPLSSGHKRIYEDLTHRELPRLGGARAAHLTGS